MAHGSQYVKAAAVYARTLLALAKSQGVEAAVTGEMQALSSLFAKEKAVVRALHNPALSGDKKTQLTQVLADRATPLTAKLLRLLATKNRLAVLPALADTYLRLEEKSRNIRRAKVISAVAMSAEQLKQLADLLAAKMPGSTYRLENTVDSNLVAGFRVEEGDRILDASLRHKLDSLRQKLAA